MVEVDGPAFRFQKPIMRHRHAAYPGNVIEQRIRRLWRQYFITTLGEQLEAVPVGHAGAGCDEDLLPVNGGVGVVMLNSFSSDGLAKWIRPIYTRIFQSVCEDFGKKSLRINNSVFVNVTSHQ